MNFPNKRILHIKSDDQFINVYNITEQTIQIVLGDRTSVAWQYIFKVATIMLVKPSPLKRGSLVKFMTNLSIRNFIYSPSSWLRIIKEKAAWNEAGSYGPYLFPLCSQSVFYLWKNFSQWINLIKEMRKCRNKGKQSKEMK